MNYLKQYDTGGDYWQKINLLFNLLIVPPLTVFFFSYVSVKQGLEPVIEPGLKLPVEFGAFGLSMLLVGWSFWQSRKTRKQISGTFKERLDQYAVQLFKFHIWLCVASLLLAPIMLLTANEYYAAVFMIPFALFSAALPSWRRIRLGAKLDRPEWETLRKKEHIPQ